MLTVRSQCKVMRLISYYQQILPLEVISSTRGKSSADVYLPVFDTIVQIIALHLAMTMGGAEFYPSCTQILIGGNGNTQPDSTVSFPGAYHDDDPGIYVPNVRPGPNFAF